MGKCAHKNRTHGSSFLTVPINTFALYVTYADRKIAFDVGLQERGKVM